MNLLVVIVREGVAEVTEFEDDDTARTFFDEHAQQWTESFLCRVLAGPGRPVDATEARLRLMQGVWNAALEEAAKAVDEADRPTILGLRRGQRISR